ncbi:MAG TPA: LysR family transcriptional regulator [Solirubrobacteraceae bacterium]|jgi:DNA-binding transcriptional LysR family regulator
MASDFSVTALRVVREVAARGSFSAAADRLGYTQSAVSRQVALAERVAGTALFERMPRGVRPTGAGRLLLRRADAVVAELEAARHELGDLAVPAPRRLRVGAFSTAMAVLVPRAIAALPETRITLHEGGSPSHLRRLAAGRLDAAVVTAPERPPGDVRVAALLDDPLLLAVGRTHRLAGGSSVDPNALHDERWVAASHEPAGTLLGAWTASSWSPEVAFVAKDWVAKLGLVAAGLAVTVVPGLAASTLPDTISVVRIDDPAATRTIALATREDRDADAFAEALRDAAAEHGAELRSRLRDERGRVTGRPRTAASRRISP